MKLIYKIIFGIPLGLVSILCVFLAIGIIDFNIRHRILLRDTPPPSYLTYTEISIIETALGVTFPQSSTQIKAYFNHDHDSSLNCFVEFAEGDLENFKAGHNWFSINRKDLVAYESGYIFFEDRRNYIAVRNLRRPFRRTVKFYGGTVVPLEWWNISKERVQWVSSTPAPTESDGHIDILLESPVNGKIHAYIARHSLNKTFPSDIFNVFPISNSRWDFRESSAYPNELKVE